MIDDGNYSFHEADNNYYYYYYYYYYDDDDNDHNHRPSWRRRMALDYELRVCCRRPRQAWRPHKGGNIDWRRNEGEK